MGAEVVLRGDYAKQAGALVVHEGETATAMVAHLPFGWSHEVWKPSEASESRIVAQRSDKQQAGPVRWLFGDVVSAIVKNHNEGLIDARLMFERLIAPKLLK